MSEKDRYDYHSRSPEEWERIDREKEGLRSTSRMPRRGKFILFFNVVLIAFIVFAYIATQKERNVMSQSLKTIGDFQIYISSEKNDFLCGEPLEFKVYVTNISSKKKDFSIYSFNVKISSAASSDVYSFHFDRTIHSSIEGKRSVLVYDLKREVNLAYLKAGTYTVDVLINFNGKAVNLIKKFKYLSKIRASLVSGQDFFKVGEGGKFSVYVKNNTPKGVNLSFTGARFKIINEDTGKIPYKRYFAQPVNVFLAPAQGESLYTFNMPPLKEPGKYTMQAELIGSTSLVATSSFLVVDAKKVSSPIELKLNSDIPMVVSQNEPVNFSLWLLNTSLAKKFVTINSITIRVEKGNVELYRFSDRTSHNVVIPSGGTRLLVSSQSWKAITLPSSGVYLFDAIVKIGDKYLEYRQKIRSY